MKVSREGVVLIKSFVGFRSKAILGEDGRWVIGYGHTASAREGLTVAEPDAELLLQYDLLPVVKSLNGGIARTVNQHQFDALASFALSIGVDRFLGSDVLQALNEGLPTRAADALIGWPAPVPVDAATRRRIAERALFNADPDQPVHLADLLTAPLPQPTEDSGTVESPGTVVDARAAAVATLLGEPAGTEEPAAANEVATEAPEPLIEAPAATSEPETHEPEPATFESAPPEPVTTTAPQTPQPLPPESASSALSPIPGVMNLQRYSPYAAGIVGPLPGLTTVPLAPTTPSAATAPVSPTATAPAIAMSIRMAVAVAPDDTANGSLIVAEPAEAPAAAETEMTAVSPTETIATVPATADTVVTPFAAFAAAPVTAPALVLTPDSPDAAVESRPVWPEAHRDEPAVNQEPLFVEEPGLSVLRHETEPGTPARFERSQTGAFLIMGGVGLLASAFSAAAFRLALEEPSPMGETTVVAWTLAVIGGVCVVVSSLNLYMRWGRAQQD